MSSTDPTPEPINAHWLTNRLRRNGYLPQGRVTSVGIKASHKHHFALRVAYSDAAPDSLPRDFVLKWYGGGYPYGLREGFFFEQIVPAMPAPAVPRCYDAEVDWETAQAHILLEDLSATHYMASPPYDGLGWQTFEQVVAAHLEVHAHWWDHPRIDQEDVLRVVGVGVAHEAISPQAIQENAQYFAEEVLPAQSEQLGEQYPAKGQRFFEKVIGSWADLFTRRMAGGTGLTLIQGDAQLGNMLLPRDPQLNRPVIIDWEGCTRGLGVWDLARTLIQAGLPSDERQKLEMRVLSRYQAGLAEHGIQDYGLEDCLADYRLSVLANIPHALAWENPAYLESAMQAFQDWACDELLG